MEIESATAARRVLLVRRDCSQDQILGAGELADLRRRALSHAARRSEILFIENVLQFRALDHSEFLRGRQFVRQHAAEVAACPAVPPRGSRVIAKIGHANGRLAGCQRG